MFGGPMAVQNDRNNRREASGGMRWKHGPTSNQRQLVFCALGGLGEIGTNCYLYGAGTERERKWLMVDCGIGFPNGDFGPGVDVILPDIRFVEQRRSDLAGLVLTHGHEDHIGALIELWPRLGCPVYATSFVANLIRAKLAESSGPTNIPFHDLPLDASLTIGPFEITAVRVAHSMPESQALLIKTAEGKVLHTGDWKLDATPYLGLDTDRVRIKNLGESGIDAMMCDSTNALRTGRSPSETDVSKRLFEIISEAKRAVAVTMFTSNVSRIKAVSDAAEATGRSVFVSGRAMHRMIAVAQETGYLPNSFKWKDHKHFSFLPPEKALLLCTGSQGESRAAVARIAGNEHPDVKLGKGDTVIFSSRTIPGNEKSVGRVQNQLTELGCTLVTEMEGLVHVTGHPRRDELKEMYSWVRPRIAIPMHGESRPMAAHAELAKQCGVPEVLLLRNGDVVKLAPGPAEVIDEVPVGKQFRDGKLIVGGDDSSVRERRKLAHVGVAFATVVLDSKGNIACAPDVILDGIPEFDADGHVMVDISLDAVEVALSSLPAARRNNPDLVENAVSKSVRAALERAWGKRPTVKCIVSRVG